MAPTPRPTESELDILAVLWQQGAATVRTVHETLAPHRGTGYTTTLKLMQLMAGKGLVTRTSDGQRHLYRAAVAPETARRQMLPSLVQRLFAGSTRALVQHALEQQPLDPAELAELRQLIDAHARKQS